MAQLGAKGASSSDQKGWAPWLLLLSGMRPEISKGGETRMFSKIRSNKAAFTLVEIMIVVAIIGLLAALAIPGFVKARKQSQGRRVLNEARQMDAAIDQWALEKGKQDGDSVVTAEAATYIKGGIWSSTDLLGNSYSIGNVGTNQIAISSTTKTALSGVGIDWGVY
jgi:prepilin-type N-terminal cleavage/methylation domain-containing protein